jgi:hypothetical protein
MLAMRAFLFFLFPALAASLATLQPRPALTRVVAASAVGCAPSAFAARPARPRARELQMEDAPFWQNVGRFARFGISSVAGLILGLVSPFTGLFSRSPILGAIGAALGLAVLVLTFVTLQAMESPPTEAIGLVPTIEPSMQSMLQDLYGTGN